jgi:hypothetical protein
LFCEQQEGVFNVEQSYNAGKGPKEDPDKKGKKLRKKSWSEGEYSPSIFLL